jgi:threonine dehydrogenase-like Zn-dependent dehydrogenase
VVTSASSVSATASRSTASSSSSAEVHLLGGPAPVRRSLPELIQLIWDRKINPGKVFDLTLPLEQAAEGHKAMDERGATKVLLTL